MTTLDELLDSGDEARDRTGDTIRDAGRLLRAGLYWVGWAVATAVFLVLLAVGGLLYGTGWAARRIIWPALVWVASAVRLGWEDGRKRAQPR